LTSCMYTYVWFLFWIDLSAFLVQKKKNTIFDPKKVAQIKSITSTS
jgi:hypothetical protein